MWPMLTVDLDVPEFVLLERLINICKLPADDPERLAWDTLTGKLDAAAREWARGEMQNITRGTTSLGL